jgi:hypothetical protein
MDRRWLVLACLIACQRAPEPEPVRPRRPPPIQQETEAEAPQPPTPTEAFDLPVPATDFFDFSDGRVRPGDYLIWHRPDDYQPDTTYWLAVEATSTEVVGQQDGLWIAARDAIWHWKASQRDLPVCAPLACEEPGEAGPVCKPMGKTGAGMVDEATWEDVLSMRSVPIGPRLPGIAATGLGAKSLHEAWLPLAVVNGTLVLRVESHWRLCDGGGGGRVQVKLIAPPLPAMRPAFALAAVAPPELRAIGATDQPIWGGVHQGVDGEGRWHVHDEWLIPLPAEVSEVAVESLYSSARTPAERLPAGLGADARESPSLRHAAMAKGASEDDAPRWGWSRLHAVGERREALRRAFVAEPR